MPTFCLQKFSLEVIKMLNEKIFSKVSKAQLIWWWIFRIIVISPLIFSWQSPHENIKLQIISNFVATFAWEIIQFSPIKLKISEISPTFQNFTVVQVFLASFLGAFKDFYYTVWWWDSVIHIIGGGMCVILGYEIVTALQKHYKSTVPVGILIFAAFGFSFFAGTLWEIFEFLFDQITGSDSQHWNFANAQDTYSLFSYTPERFPLMDTMIDMICNTIGAVFTSVFLLKFPYMHRGTLDVNVEIEKNKSEIVQSKSDEKELLNV